MSGGSSGSRAFFWGGGVSSDSSVELLLEEFSDESFVAGFCFPSSKSLVLQSIRIQRTMWVFIFFSLGDSVR